MEEAIYNTLSADSLKEKVQMVTAELQAAIDAGQLTAEERPQVLEQLGSKLSGVETELKRAEAEGKAKLQQKLEEQREKLRKMKAAVSDAASFSLPLRHSADIRRLRGKLAT